MMDQISGEDDSRSERPTEVGKSASTLFVVALFCTAFGLFLGLAGAGSGDSTIYNVGVRLFAPIAAICWWLLLGREAFKFVRGFLARQGKREKQTAAPIESQSAQVNNLEKLWAMKQSGAITDEEYNALKAKILDQITSD